MTITSGPLAAIIAYARMGALDHAWSRFAAAGLDRADDDAAALAVKGRLLKDFAQRAPVAERQPLYAAAAQAYYRAAQIGGTTYPLINAATLSLLAGETPGAAALAGEVLARIARHPDEPETPYYRAATRAEALLLLGRADEAQGALAEAMALAPRAWEDHASTLRQFALILAALGADAGWLEPRRPPRSLHFGGHMSFRPDSDRAPLVAEIEAFLDRERIGFGYGALAAGADIIVAEALLERGAELHLVLPGGLESFAALSVDPFGAEWRRRFDAAAARAETIRAVEPVGAAPDAVTIGLADEIAMGAALINAGLLASEAVQLLVLDTEGASGRSQALWAEGKRRQHVIRAAREDVGAPSVAAAEAEGNCLAMLAIGLRQPGEGDLTAIKAVLDRVGAASPPSFTGQAVFVTFADVAAAAEAAAAIALELGDAAMVGGHYGMAESVRDPFSGAPRIVGRALAIAEAASRSTLPGSACVTDDFAAALAVAAPAGLHAEFVGELDGPGAPVGLYALKLRS